MKKKAAEMREHSGGVFFYHTKPAQSLLSLHKGERGERLAADPANTLNQTTGTFLHEVGGVVCVTV